MISDKHKFIFVHPAKTGGTSIEVALEPHSDCKLVYGKNPRHDNPRVRYKKKNIKHIRLDPARILVGGSLVGWYVFATVRNPWDRCVSAWAYQSTIPERDVPPFSEWCPWRLSRMVPPGVTEKNWGALRPLLDQTMDFIRVNITRGEVRFVRFESLQDDFDGVCADLDLPQIELPHTLKTEHDHYSTYYDDRTRALVAEYFARDIARFGYQFEEE